MTNIKVGSLLNLDSGDSRESVIVTAITATTFTANLALAHDGSTTKFAIEGATFSPALALPTSSPAPASGKPKTGWYHLATAAEKRSAGVEPGPTAGSPLFPLSSYDKVYAVLAWCQAAGSGEFELIGH